VEFLPTLGKDGGTCFVCGDARLLVWLIRDSEREFRASPCASWRSNNRNARPPFSFSSAAPRVLAIQEKQCKERYGASCAAAGEATHPHRISCLCAGGLSAATPFDCTCAMAKLLRQRLDLLRDKLQLICLRETKGALTDDLWPLAYVDARIDLATKRCWHRQSCNYMLDIVVHKEEVKL
jgi:hypothetical protein